MRRQEFLDHPDVLSFLPWLADRLRHDDAWTHTYVDRKSEVRWRCDNLYDAFQQYQWAGAGWKETWARLVGYRRDIRAAAECRDSATALRVCEDILSWGGVSARNASYLRELRTDLFKELQHMRLVLAADRAPNRGDLVRSAGGKAVTCRMNAGFVKIYSLLVDYCVIYDGRVGAALGLLVRQFCVQTGRTTAPPPLKFAYGVPREGRSPSPKRRDPSANRVTFPQLRAGDSRGHVDNTMRASWLLRAALEREPGAFSPGEDGFHELAAALFMVGYDLGDTAIME